MSEPDGEYFGPCEWVAVPNDPEGRAKFARTWAERDRDRRLDRGPTPAERARLRKKKRRKK